MSTQPGSAQRSALVDALDALGDRTSLRVVAAVRDGVRRFTELTKRLDVTDPVLSSRLTHLVGAGLLTREASDRGVRSFHLTRPSADLWPVYAALWSWDQRWLGEGWRNDLRIIHATCGRSIVPIFGCAQCRAIGVTPRDTATSVSPAVMCRIGLTRSGRSTRLAALDHIDGAAILGDGWSTVILAGALLGRRRFGEYQSGLGPIAPATLSERLSRFVRIGMFAHVSATGHGRPTEYRLTNMARDYFPIFATVNEWARTHFALDGQTGLDVTHTYCGRSLIPRYTCNACNRTLRRPTTLFVSGWRT